MATKTENPIYAHDTLEFVTVAAEFCAHMEKCEQHSAEDMINTLLKLLPLIYMKIQLLPDVDTEGAFALFYLREPSLIFGLVENQGPVSERVLLNFAINNIALFLLLRKGENHRLMKPFHP